MRSPGHRPSYPEWKDSRSLLQVMQHSIIAVLNDRASLDASDGLVCYAHAHIDGAASELIVPSDHFCQGRSEVMLEVRRILASQVSN